MAELRHAGVRTHLNVREIAAVAGSDGALAADGVELPTLGTQVSTATAC